MLHIVPIPAFEDNYIWLLHNGQTAAVVDPGDAKPVIAALSALKLDLSHILITHHHNDHIGGVKPLINTFQPQVCSPSYWHYDFPHQALSEGDTVSLFDLTLNVMWMPGHTPDHIVYYNEKLLFCGDVLFGAGCGRLWADTAAQQLAALKRLSTLAPDTQVYCTHEYTQTNIDFALTLEPENVDLIKRKANTAAMRNAGLPSLPSTIDLELKTNPFLRCSKASIAQNIGLKNSDELAVFAKIRQLRNHY